MMQRKYNLFVALVFSASFTLAQGYKPTPTDVGRVVNENKNWGNANSGVPSLQYKYSSESNKLKPVHIELTSPIKQPVIEPIPEQIPPAPPEQEHFSMVKPSAYYENLGFFCRKEIQLQRVTTVPVKFRLGSYEYVNWLEGKDKFH